MRQRKNSLISYIEKRFYQYEKIKKAVWEVRNDFGIDKPCENNTGHELISNPTANLAVKNVMPIKAVIIQINKNEFEIIKQPEKWVQVIETTYEHYADSMSQKVLKYRYCNKSYQETCQILHISRSTYYQLITEVQQYAIACACQLGLIKIF